MIIGRTRNDHEVAPWRIFFASDQLADRTDSIDDGRTRRVCHEALQGFVLACYHRLGKLQRVVAPAATSAASMPPNKNILRIEAAVSLD
jgi:hypothetical protein